MTAMRSLFLGLLNRNRRNLPETLDKEQYAHTFAQFKALLLAQYQRRLQAKTARRLPINLSAKSVPFGAHPSPGDLYLDAQTVDTQDIAAEIGKLLNRCHRLMITGDPGAGKTMVLLYAAVNILQRDKDIKLPLLLNLATWREGNDFETWYAQIIAHSYDLSAAFVNELLKANDIVPFFDGFDEVPENSREGCLRAMAGYFGDSVHRQLVVSSRKREYAAMQVRAPVYAEVAVQPLSLEQVQKALFENGQTYRGDLVLLYALDRDELLAKVVETPFYLNTASFLFGKGQKTWQDFSFQATSTEGRQEELVRAFVEEQAPDPQDKRYLSFLAAQMEKESFLVFELLRMQPQWAGNIWRYRLLLGCMGGLVIGTAFGLLYGVFGGFLGGMQTGLISGFICWGITWPLLAIFVSDRIAIVEIQHWDKNAFLKNWKKTLTLQVFKGLRYGAILSFMVYMILNLVDMVFTQRVNVIHVIDFVKFILLMGLPGGLLFGLVSGLNEAGKMKNILLHVPSPYQRFLAAFKLCLWDMPGILTALGMGMLSFQMIEGENSFQEALLFLFGWVFALFWVPVLLLMLLLQPSLLQHFTLRTLLFLDKKLPLRLVGFLDRMSEQYLFEDNRPSVGGVKQRGATWRFRHKILQDYFAALHKATR